MGESAGEKTELPTQKRLRDARKKGQVCTSKDIVSTVILIVLFCMAGGLGPVLVDDFQLLLGSISRELHHSEFSVLGPSSVFAGIMIAKHSFLFAVVAAVIGVVGNVAQIGFLFTGEPLKPNLNKLNPVEGVKKIFSKKNLFELGKNLLKVTFLSYLIYKLIWTSIPELLGLCYGTVSDIMPCMRVILKRLAWYTGFGYVLIAVVDRLFQGKHYLKEMMMTKDEVKREYKETEGSGEVKQAQRQFRNEILNDENPAQATKRSDVVITNPTHLSIGIRYKADEGPLPQIVVAGADADAKIIRETALQEGIPLYEDVPLAHALWEKGYVNEWIPGELIEPVAEVLKWVKRLNEARKEEAELEAVNVEDEEWPDDLETAEDEQGGTL